jgi:uncharacterized delta-60 repeat protein
VVPSRRLLCRVRLVPFGLALVGALALASVALALSGDLDSGFGTGGKATAPIGTGDDHANGLAVQWNDKLLIAGRTDNGVNDDFGLARFNRDGSPDTNFGTGGTTTTTFGTDDDVATSVLVQENHKLVAGGWSYNGEKDVFAIARYNKNGTPDKPFGTSGDGKVVISFGPGDDRAYASAFRLLPDNSFNLILAGSSDNGGTLDFAVARTKRDGTPDTVFSSNGKVRTVVGTGDSAANAVTVILKNGKVIAAGYASNGTDNDFALVRYQNGGQLDPDFGSAGITMTPIGSGSDVATAIAMQPVDGKLVVAGYTDNGTDDDFALVRYAKNGIPDPTFGTGGIVTTPIGSGDDQAYAVTVQDDGKILVAGRTWNGSDWDFALVRYNANGTPDSGFGTGGKVTTAFGTGDDGAVGVGIQKKKSRIVVAGSSFNGANDDFAVARFQP